MGEIIEIVEQTAPGIFRILFTATGEERKVELDPDKVILFSAPGTPIGHSGTCPFLRKRAPGTRVCTVHASRPELCRQYSCFRVLVCDGTGARIGRVWDGSRYFTTTDPLLRDVWNREIAVLEIPEEMKWEAAVGQILTGAGYRVIL